MGREILTGAMAWRLGGRSRPRVLGASDVLDIPSRSSGVLEACVEIGMASTIKIYFGRQSIPWPELIKLR